MWVCYEKLSVLKLKKKVVKRLKNPKKQSK